MKKEKIFYVTLIVFIAILVSVMLSLSLYQCSIDNKENNKENFFSVINTFHENYRTYRIVYDKNTKVKYIEVRGNNSYSITPLYNTDGTVQIYGGEQDE